MPQISRGRGEQNGLRGGGKIFNEKEDTERQNIDLDYFIIPPKTPRLKYKINICFWIVSSQSMT